jgi:hypothetical protein
MKKVKYKGVVDPGKVPCTKTELEDDSPDPDYVKKLKHKKRIGTNIQLKLWGNPFDPNY